MSSCPQLTAPNLSDCRLWLRHEVNSDDTLTHLALKYGTTIGQLCRANRMHSQDKVQMRRYIWLPLLQADRQAWRDEDLKANGKVIKEVPPHFLRQSDENHDDYAEDCDPLLITTKCM